MRRRHEEEAVATGRVELTVRDETEVVAGVTTRVHAEDRAKIVVMGAIVWGPQGRLGTPYNVSNTTRLKSTFTRHPSSAELQRSETPTSDAARSSQVVWRRHSSERLW